MIARKSFLIIISKITAQFIGWIGLTTLAKLWGAFAPEALGILGFAMSFIAMFDLIADLGFYTAHVKKVSEGNDLGTCIGTYAAIKICLTAAMVFFVFLSIFIWKNVLKQNFYDATTESVLFVCLLYYILTNLSQILFATFEGRKEIAKRELGYIFETIKTPLMIMVAAAGVTGIAVVSPTIQWPSFLKPLQSFLASHAVGSLAMTYVLGIAASIIVALWLFRKYPVKKPNKVLAKNYTSFALPILLISSIGVISVNIDKVMLGYFWTSVEVGYYFSIQQILQMLMIFHIAVGTVLFPTFSEYSSDKNLEKIKKAAYLSERYVSMVMVAPTIVIFIFSGPVINIVLSSAFLPAASSLMVLAIYVFLLSLQRPYFSLISGINKPFTSAVIGGACCSINIILNFLFIPKQGVLSQFGVNGPLGAAIATAISGFIGLIWLKFAAKKLVGINLLQRHTPIHIFAGILMGIFLYLFVFTSGFFGAIHWYHLIIFSLTGLGIYLLILFLLKEFTKQDFHFFLNLLHPKEMLKYLSSELKAKDDDFTRK